MLKPYFLNLFSKILRLEFREVNVDALMNKEIITTLMIDPSSNLKIYHFFIFLNFMIMYHSSINGLESCLMLSTQC